MFFCSGLYKGFSYIVVVYCIVCNSRVCLPIFKALFVT